MEIFLALFVAAAVSLAWDLFSDLWGARSGPAEIPQSLETEMSEYDIQKIQETQNLIQECFCIDGQTVVDSLAAMSNLDRIKAAEEFAKKLAVLYDLDIRIDVNIDDPSACGAYYWGEKMIRLNLVELMVDGKSPDFAPHIMNFIDTVIHEERHAVQHRALMEPGFWGIDEETQGRWAWNLEHYIRPEVDVEGYAKQPIESDAFTFANLVIQGVRISNE